jgi:nucleotide-binding universal stress UspA family protein
MATIEHILFPFDFSKQGFHAVRFVRALAKRCQARITVIGIVPPLWEAAPMAMPVIPVDYDRAERDLASRLETALARELDGLPVRFFTCSGDPALKITEFAHGNGIDLVMMPTHECGLFRSMLIGSVTAKVLHDAKCAVWTATHSEEQRSPEMPSTILCAVDCTSAAAPALLKWAAGFSGQLGATLKLVHVVPRISDWLALPSERDLQEHVREEARIQIASLQRGAGIELPARIAVGLVTVVVTEQARQEGADLVIIGRGSLPSPLGRLRTHSYGIIQKSPCPVLSV